MNVENLDINTNKHEKPLVTIFSLVYNNAEYVIPALQSIKDQHYRPVEHIIIDDHSTDNSEETIKNWIDKNHYKCTYIIHKKNKGICATINEVILIAKGKYMYGVSDDLMMPDKLINDVEYLEANPNYAFCTTNMIVRDIATNTETKTNLKPLNFKDLLYNRLNLSTPSTVYNRQALIDVGLFDENIFFEDLDILLRLLYKYPAGFRKDYSVIYCIHPKSVRLQREIEFQQAFFEIYKKWKHLPDYRRFTNWRHAYAFWHFSDKNKREAVKHLLPAANFFWKPVFLKGLIKLFIK